jgi:hypothetical protein
MTLVHDVAAELIRSLRNGRPDFAVDQDAVLFGASIHDIGKVMHPNELFGPGHDHEQVGPRLLERLVSLLSVPASRLPLPPDSEREGEHDD